jgi:uncharacterized membrane protein
LSIFSFFKKKQLLTADENRRIVEAIRLAEMQTSGEIRVFIESRCRYVDPLDRAQEVFYGLKMQHTDDRNGVLIYVAIKDRQMAVHGDEGIHAKVNDTFWLNAIQQMKSAFSEGDFVNGIGSAAMVIGDTLKKEFPYTQEDRNELPDEIVFGK